MSYMPYHQLAHHYAWNRYKKQKWFCFKPQSPILCTFAFASCAFILLGVVIIVQLFIAHEYVANVFEENDGIIAGHTDTTGSSDVILLNSPLGWIRKDRNHLERQAQSAVPLNSVNDASVISVLSSVEEQTLKRQVALLQQEVLTLKKHQQRHCWQQHVSFLQKPAVYANEYEVNPYSYFTFTKFYPSNLGLGKRVVEKPIGKRRKELNEVIGQGISMLNAMKRTEQKMSVVLNASHAISVSDFVEGITAQDPLKGTYYHLYFRAGLADAKRAAKSYHKLTFLRPLGDPLLVSNELVSTNKEIVHLIVPVNEEVIQ